MSTFKRCISLLMAMLILVGVFAPAAQAAPAEETATVNADGVTVEGTNGFGNLLSQEITESQEEAEAAEEEYPGGYTVTALVIEGNTATVTYDTMEAAALVVALYTEDGMQMLTSTTATVTPDATEAELTFEGDMPEYFLASAFLLDSYDFSPLCAAYDTPMYTREMQELLASTVEDYNPEKVLNLDDDNTTNFAVYAESTIVIDAEEGVNTVTGIDDENTTYVIENADEQITLLAAGDVFVYPYAEGEILIVKVATIEIDGTTATIMGTELELEEVFAQMKIESSSETTDLTVDDSTAAEGISYVGLEEEGTNPQAWEGGGSATASHTFKVDIEKEKESDHVDASFSVTGSLKVSIDVGFNYYISLKRQFIEFKATPSVTLGVNISGNVTGKYPIGNFGVTPVAGVFIGFSPEIQLKFEGTVDLSANVSMTIGFGFSSDKGFENLTTKPKVTFNLSVEGKLFFGVDFKPNAKIIHENVASFTIGAAVGFELTAKMSGTLFEYFESDAERKHTCTTCLGLDVDFKATLDGELKFLNCDWLTLKVKVADLTFDLGSWHKSSEAEEFKKGGCKNYVYRLTVHVQDKEEESITDASVTVNEESTKTNSKGNAAFYLPEGDYMLTASDGELVASAFVELDDACKVNLMLKEKEEEEEPSKFWESMLDITKIVDYEEALQNARVTFGGHTYTLFDSVVSTWEDAKVYCESLGGHLATITSAEEDVFLYTYLRNCGKTAAFFGLNDLRTEGVWEWVTGEPVVYTNWSAGEPNNDGPGEEDVCSYSYLNDGKWNDSIFDNDMFVNSDDFLCEWDYEIKEIDGSQCISDGNTLAPTALYPGDYDTEITDTYTLKTASFKDLVPGEQYVLLAMVSVEVEDPLASDNLLFIDQAAALEDGTLVFQYVQRTPCDISYVVACGASHKNLKDAEVSFPEMVVDGELQVVDPVVVYDGETLTEGRDYVIVGKVDFTEAGEYTCYIRGIHNYTGLVECIYRVTEKVTENPFTDVMPGSYFYEPVLWALKNGITSGTSATTFSPDSQCVRSQVVTFLWRAAGSPEPTRTDNPFVDVKSTDYYYKPVLWALENGITSGVDATHFGAAVNCSREQVVTFLYQAKGRPAINGTANPFTDVVKGSYYEKPVLWALENGITSGMGDGTFGVSVTCTRAQIVTFLYKAFVNK